jgi:enoyl-CoA hydratase/carnithine racemase
MPGGDVSFEPPETMLIETKGPVTVVTMNNPEMRNAFTDELHDAMQHVWEHLGKDPSCKVAVLTGAGRAFSAGGNVPGFIRDYEDAEHRRQNLRGARALMDAMAAFHKPLIAAVNGPAVGLGCSVAVGCDIVLIAQSAFIADTHVNIGLVAGDGGAVAWPLMMSLLRAKEYLFTGDRIPAEEAVKVGLANRVVPDDQLMTEALALAQRLAEQPPQAIQETKRALNLHLQAAIDMVAPFALSAESESFATEDLKHTIDGFRDMLEKQRREQPA